MLNKEVDLGEPTSFLDHANLGCTRRHCETSKDIVDNYVFHAARIWLCSTRVLHSARVCCRRCATCEYVSPRSFCSGLEGGSPKGSRSRSSFLPWLRSLAHVGCSLKWNKRGRGIKDSAALFISDTLKKGAMNLEVAKKLREVSRKWEQLNKNKSFCMTKWEDVTNEKYASF